MIEKIKKIVREVTEVVVSPVLEVLDEEVKWQLIRETKTQERIVRIVFGRTIPEIPRREEEVLIEIVAIVSTETEVMVSTKTEGIVSTGIEVIVLTGTEIIIMIRIVRIEAIVTEIRIELEVDKNVSLRNYQLMRFVGHENIQRSITRIQKILDTDFVGL